MVEVTTESGDSGYGRVRRPAGQRLWQSQAMARMRRESGGVSNTTRVSRTLDATRVMRRIAVGQADSGSGGASMVAGEGGVAGQAGRACQDWFPGHSGSTYLFAEVSLPILYFAPFYDYLGLPSLHYRTPYRSSATRPNSPSVPPAIENAANAYNRASRHCAEW
ncbi:hypothetical protein MA16_Dca013778 [Dendrobium catenatum]|uniref:Uncharacterized protein n=1 Tax=Dendrobium catenatum TaxID=906689 RepID=A0A2I0VWG1_9ASPA|nr:hypothetical protein MA16_Dca013778 [Dendrobium catenatum]